MQPRKASGKLPEIGYLVIQWKDRPDAREPWWVHWYYDHIYVPFQRFSFKWFRIPRAKQASVTSDEKGRTTTTFSWFENGGFFDDRDRADLACIDEQDGYKPIYKNRPMPKDSAEIGAVVFPRSKKPARWYKPTATLLLKERKQEEQEQRERKQEQQELAECLSQINQVLEPHHR